jgi:uncharacterized membrane protein
MPPLCSFSDRLRQIFLFALIGLWVICLSFALASGIAVPGSLGLLALAYGVYACLFNLAYDRRYPIFFEA